MQREGVFGPGSCVGSWRSCAFFRQCRARPRRNTRYVPKYADMPTCPTTRHPTRLLCIFVQWVANVVHIHFWAIAQRRTGSDFGLSLQICSAFVRRVLAPVERGPPERCKASAVDIPWARLFCLLDHISCGFPSSPVCVCVCVCVCVRFSRRCASVFSCTVPQKWLRRSPVTSRESELCCCANGYWKRHVRRVWLGRYPEGTLTPRATAPLCHRESSGCGGTCTAQSGRDCGSVRGGSSVRRL